MHLLAAIALALCAATPAAAQALSGVWTTERTCEGPGRRLTFGAASLELSEGGRPVFQSAVAYARDENRTEVTILRIEAALNQPGQPQAGDVLVFRRVRDLLYLDDHRRNGRAIARLDGAPPLRRCP